MKATGFTVTQKQELTEIVYDAIETRIEPRFSMLEKRLGSVGSNILVLKKGQEKIQKDLNGVIVYFDREYIEHKKRLRKIETHLGIAL